jgi:Ca2+-binding RTX toxin-like protein
MAGLFAPHGGYFVPNTVTHSHQGSASIARLSNGNFVVVWSDESQLSSPDTSVSAIKAQVFDSSGSRIGFEFVVNTRAPGAQTDPQVAALANGGFVVSWDDRGSGGAPLDIRAQVFSGPAAFVGPEILVNTTTAGTQSENAIARLADGGFVVVWTHDTEPNGVSGDIYGQRFDAAGNKVGGEFIVDAPASTKQVDASVAGLAGGGFVVTWTDPETSADGNGSAVRGRVYNADGTAAGAEFVVNTDAPGNQGDSDVTALAGGGFVVTWTGADGSGLGVRAQVFDAGGAKLGAEQIVNTTTLNSQFAPAVTALASGGFVVSWSHQIPSTSGGPDSYKVLAQSFDAGGAKAGTEFLVQDAFAWRSDVAEAGNGGLAVVWEFYSDLGARVYQPSAGITDLALDRTSVSETVPENTVVATIAPTLTAVNATPAYSVVADSTGGAFGIIGDKLVVIDASRLDHETATTATVTIRASGGAGGYYEETFSLSIADAAIEQSWSAAPQALVNTQTNSSQSSPAVTALAGGGFVVVWEDRSGVGGDPYETGIKAQLYDADGNRVGGEFRINNTVIGIQSRPEVSALTNGGFVVTWTDSGSNVGDPDSYSVRAQVYNAAGAKVGGEFPVNAVHAGAQTDSVVAGLSGGGYAVAWADTSGQGGDSDASIKVRVANAAGTIFTRDILVNTTTAGFQSSPVILGLSNGGLAVAWSGDGARMQLFNALGQKVGGEILVAASAGASDLVALEDGSFAVAFVTSAGAGVQRYDLTGAPLGDAILVAGADQVSLTQVEGGGFLLTYERSGGDGAGTGLLGQFYDSSGNAAGSEFIVNLLTAGDQTGIATTTLPSGAIALVWQDNSEMDGDASWNSVRMRVISPTEAQSAVAKNDAFVTDEATGISGNILADNGSGADAGSTQVTAVNGSPTGVGATVRLASGALLTLNADGTFSYDPNGAFDHLAQFGSGGSNQSAVDVFNYTLADSNTAIVTVTVRGIYSQPHVIQGTPGDDVLNGTPQADVFAESAGADIMWGGHGDDVYHVDHSGDRANETSASGGTDAVHASVSFTLGANVEHLILTGSGNITGVGNGLANTIVGNSGNNTLSGGAGADSMTGRAGNDVYLVDDAADAVTELAGEGTDRVESSITYTLGAELENLTLTGGAAVDGTGNGLANVITGNGAANVLTGLAGDDRLDGKGAADTLAGGIGNDVYVVDDAGDTVTEAADEGTDTVESLISHTLGANVEILTLVGTAHVNGAGNALNNVLNGNSGNNVLDGGAGNDSMFGGAGDDIYIVSEILDKAIETGVTGGDDHVMASVSFQLGANVERLTLTGTGNINAFGNAGANIVVGNSGNNTVSGGAGADTMIGGAGQDIYYVDDAGDTIVENAGEGNDTVSSSITYTLGANLESLILTGNGAINGTGNALGNKITGNNGNNELNGGAGNDTLTGGLGADTLIGAEGDDTYVIDSFDTLVETSGGGNDTVQTSQTYTLLDQFEYLVLTGNLNVNGTGNAANNVLTGNSGNNVLDGAAGADNMYGGFGNDTYVVDHALDRAIETSAAGGTDTVLSAVSFTLSPNVENLTLTGSANTTGIGNDLANVIQGNAGNNVIVGGGGADALSGGAGSDVFVYRTTAESTAATRDAIADFASGDKIDLSQIDADAHTAGTNDAFTFIGAGAFTNVAGQLRAYKSGTEWIVEGDTNADGTADLVIGLTTANAAIIAADFVL